MSENTKTSGQCTPVSVKVKRCVSVLPNDYTVLENLPTINGVSLIGNTTAQDLELLSSKGEDYETVSLLKKQEVEGYLVIIGGERPTKIALNKFLEEAGKLSYGEGFETVDVINPDAPIGTYQFVEKN